jgi:Fe2+ or Zn2+ uptake regulation protein
MIGRTANKVLDKLHQATVGVLVLSTVYFGVEAFRATWYIQKHKAEQRVLHEQANASGDSQQ